MIVPFSDTDHMLACLIQVTTKTGFTVIILLMDAGRADTPVDCIFCSNGN